MTLTTNPYLAQRLKKEYSYTSSPPLDLRCLFQGEINPYCTGTVERYMHLNVAFPSHTRTGSVAGSSTVEIISSYVISRRDLKFNFALYSAREYVGIEFCLLYFVSLYSINLNLNLPFLMA